MIKHLYKYFLFIVLLGVSSVSFALESPICTEPNCKIYTVSSSDGVKISATDWSAKLNKKQAIVFIHGFPHDQYLWFNQINAFKNNKNYKIVTIDWRGFGLSGKPENPAAYTTQTLGADVNAVITALNLDKVILVPHSAGGIPMLGYIQHYGASKVKGLVITDAIADGLILVPQAGYVPPDAFAAIGATVAAPTADAFQQANQVFLTLGAYKPLDPGLNNYLLMHDLISPQSVRAALLGSLEPIAIETINAREDIMNKLASANVKTLIVWGAEDAIILSTAADYLDGIIPNSQKVLIPEVGHLPMIENSGLYNQTLTNFIDTLN